MPEFSALVFATAISMLYRSIITVIAPDLSRDLQLTADELGTLASLFFIGFAVVQLPVGIALDRLGPRLTIVSFMVLAISGTALFATSSTLWMACAGQLLIGAGCAPLMTGSMVVISRRYSPEHFAYMTALILTLANLGDLFSTVPFAFISETLGWRGALWIILAITSCSALACLLFLGRDRQAEGSTPESLSQMIGGMGRVALIRAIWPILPLVLTGYAALMTIRGLWAGPWLADEYLLTMNERGYLLLGMSLMMTLGMYLYGFLDRQTGQRKSLIIAGTLLLILSIIPISTPSPPFPLAAFSLMMIGLFGYTYALLMAHCRSFIPAQLMGRGIAYLTLVGFFGVGLLQTLSGWLMKHFHSYSLLHASLAAILIIAIVCYSRSKAPAE
ncbi:MFS transporter [Oceanospirillum linum]|uniref:Major facilitator superfamily (MFS) profile domain-containing protein n=1 Tax=Oceanospirillum linum TaxID=966 RepID=A0A1T1HG53_OCELI|nr:MFS transporter [Oceanospirillum linum]OOV88720.1 hypothetical protein BTA35_0204375 [Oceanospirillum linum]SEG01693.1 Predicted arabinose efflux permease, MFS family [Oleiphilus messinensis]SMP21792.1 Predicted arabinose efflux permease, MFS family [Oceanospirillum linum]